MLPDPHPPAHLPPSTPGRGPLIVSVVDVAGRDRCTPDGHFRIVGSGFGEWEHPPHDAALYLVPVAGGRPVQVFRILSWRDHQIDGIWPACVSGPQKLVLDTRYPPDPLVRGTRYPQVLG